MCVCVRACVRVFATLRMLYRLTSSFMYDLHCVEIIDFYWTIKKMLFPIHFLWEQTQ